MTTKEKRKDVLVDVLQIWNENDKRDSYIPNTDWKIDLVHKQFKELRKELYILNPSEFTSEDMITIMKLRSSILERIKR